MSEENWCCICDRPMRKATADDMNGLIWDIDEEKWFCPNCYKKYSINKVI